MPPLEIISSYTHTHTLREDKQKKNVKADSSVNSEKDVMEVKYNKKKK